MNIQAFRGVFGPWRQVRVLRLPSEGHEVLHRAVQRLELARADHLRAKTLQNPREINRNQLKSLEIEPKSAPNGAFSIDFEAILSSVAHFRSAAETTLLATTPPRLPLSSREVTGQMVRPSDFMMLKAWSSGSS